MGKLNDTVKELDKEKEELVERYLRMVNREFNTFDWSSIIEKLKDVPKDKFVEELIAICGDRVDELTPFKYDNIREYIVLTSIRDSLTNILEEKFQDIALDLAQLLEEKIYAIIS